MCAQLGVARSSFYAWRARAGQVTATQARREALKMEVERVFHKQRGTAGCRRIAAILNDEGHPASVGLVADLMRELGLAAIQAQAVLEAGLGLARQLLREDSRRQAATRADGDWAAPIIDTRLQPPGRDTAFVGRLEDEQGKFNLRNLVFEGRLHQDGVEELLRLWEEVRFTLLFVTHSIEEALVVGNRILLLSPHPGRVRAEIHSHQYDLHSLGAADFQASARRIHSLLFEDGQAPVADAELIGRAREAIAKIYIAPQIITYIVDLARATRQTPSLALGVSPRGATRMLGAARAHAWLSGRHYVTPDDVKALAHMSLSHRVILRPEAQMDGLDVGQVLDSIIATTEVPR